MNTDRPRRKMLNFSEKVCYSGELFTPEYLMEHRRRLLKELAKTGVNPSDVSVKFEIVKYYEAYEPQPYTALDMCWSVPETDDQMSERLAREARDHEEALNQKREQLQKLKLELGEA